MHGTGLEERFRRLLDATPDGMVIVDRGGKVILINAAAEALFGYAREELLGQQVEVLIPERFRGAHPAHRQAYVGAPRTRLMGAGGLDLYGLRKDGTEFPAEISLSPLEIEEGMVAITGIRDITERKRVERELLQAKAAADAANRELESFSYAVAHDLRAPLRSITSFSQLLTEQLAGKIEARPQEHLRRVAAAAQRMGALIEALLALSQVNRAATKLEPVDVAQLVRSVAAQLRDAHPDRPVELAVQDLPPAVADRQLLRPLLENLLGNAWKFTGKRDAARIEVGASLPEQGGPAVYFVRDNGVGFDMTHADKLFTPFQRMHPASQFPGSGIGLATVHRIVARHGGRIWAEGAVGEGATFYFTLAPGAEAPA